MDTPESPQRQREALHRLIDRLPESTLQEAHRYLDLLRLLPDPIVRALRLAPPDDEVYSEEERDAVKEAREEWMQGRVRSLDDVRRELGL